MFLAKRNKGKEKGTSFSCSSALFSQAGCTCDDEVPKRIKRSLKWCGKFELLKLQENEKTIDNGGEGTNRWTEKYLKR
jgi:hypothetical protein